MEGMSNFTNLPLGFAAPPEEDNKRDVIIVKSKK